MYYTEKLMRNVHSTKIVFEKLEERLDQLYLDVTHLIINEKIHEDRIKNLSEEIVILKKLSERFIVIEQKQESRKSFNSTALQISMAVIGWGIVIVAALLKGCGKL